MTTERSLTGNVLRSCTAAIAGAIFFCLAAAPSFAQSSGPAGSKQDESLKGFLQAYAGTSDHGKTTRYSAAFVDLRGDKVQEAIVYLTSDGWCESGGCAMLILEPRDSSYRVVTKTTITQLPIRVLTTKSNGWLDLAVRVQGGAFPFGYEAGLSFDGKTYPTNAAAPPARKLERGLAGQVLILPSAEAKPLF